MKPIDQQQSKQFLRSYCKVPMKITQQVDLFVQLSQHSLGLILSFFKTKELKFCRFISSIEKSDFDSHFLVFVSDSKVGKNFSEKQVQFLFRHSSARALARSVAEGCECELFVAPEQTKSYFSFRSTVFAISYLNSFNQIKINYWNNF